MEAIGARAPQPASETPSEGLLSPRLRVLTIGLILVVTLAAFEALAVATAMPVVEEDLSGLRLYGLVFAGFMVGNLVGTGYAGLEADRREPVRPFTVGIIVFAAGLLIGGLAPTMEVVVLARIVQGFGSGCIATVAYVGIARGYDEALRPRMFAVLSSAWVVPGLIGPAMAGAIAEHLTWRLVFIGLLPALAFSAVLTVPAMRHLAAGDHRTADGKRLGQSLVLAVGAGFVLGGTTIQAPFAAGPMVVIGLGVGFFALRTLLPKGTFVAAPGLPAAVAVMGLICLAFFGTEAFLPLMLNDVRGQSPTIAGLCLTAASITWTAGAWVQAQRATRWSRRAMVMVGFLLTAAGIGISTSTVSDSVPVPAAAVGWGVAGFGMGLAYTNISLAILGGLPGDQAGYASSSLQLANIIGVAVGTGVCGAIVGAGDAADWSTANTVAISFGLMGAAALVATAVAVRLPDAAPA